MQSSSESQSPWHPSNGSNGFHSINFSSGISAIGTSLSTIEAGSVVTMGAVDGNGDSVGSFVGLSVGDIDGSAVGIVVGFSVGIAVVGFNVDSSVELSSMFSKFQPSNEWHSIYEGASSGNPLHTVSTIQS